MNSSNKMSEAKGKEQPEPQPHSSPKQRSRKTAGLSAEAEQNKALNKTHNNIIKNLIKDYPAYKFKVGAQEHWSPKTKTITYNPDKTIYGVLHELAHAILDHASYYTDFQLLKMESDAWELAVKIGQKYGISINDDYIQNCLDTYRDWLHRRSTCPSCNTHVLQSNSSKYHCYNCQTTWRVSSGKFVRSYRKVIK
jgi:predicted RNA-binding Zn-ribbon protein involved in translation (DUF1610 family)